MGECIEMQWPIEYPRVPGPVYQSLIAIWALLHFPGCDQNTAGTQPYTTFQGPFNMHDFLPGPPWSPLGPRVP
jgi:hypothetical protein